jgi:hypothetical protein
MTVLADDPLIAGMAIAHPRPLHESSGRLRELYPACPRVYGVAVRVRRRGDGRRRPAALVAARLGADHRPAAPDVRDRRW